MTMELNENPESTWGATEEYKAEWQEKYGTRTPNASATKAEWVAFATEHGGMSEADAEAMKRDELVDKYGAGQTYVAPSATNEPTDAAQENDGAGPSPSAGDPAVRTASTRP